MSKNTKKDRNYYDYIDDEEYDDLSYRQQKKERRKQRRIKNALKTKNIEELMKYEEEY